MVKTAKAAAVAAGGSAHGPRGAGGLALRLCCLLFAASALAACQQAGAAGSGQSGSAATAQSSSSASTPASDSALLTAALAPGGGDLNLSQALASGQAFTTVVDRQGVNWSVEIGQPYDAASGRICRPLRFTAISHGRPIDRIACSNGGVWTVMAPLRGSDTGPRL